MYLNPSKNRHFKFPDLLALSIRPLIYYRIQQYPVNTNCNSLIQVKFEYQTSKKRTYDYVHYSEAGYTKNANFNKKEWTRMTQTIYFVTFMVTIASDKTKSWQNDASFLSFAVSRKMRNIFKKKFFFLSKHKLRTKWFEVGQYQNKF